MKVIRHKFGTIIELGKNFNMTQIVSINFIKKYNVFIINNPRPYQQLFSLTTTALNNDICRFICVRVDIMINK